ncbi:helix-turn-helix transcriptional regulator [Acinetobacter sp. C26M]|uniref:HTH luxR-type domain-containing protein n=1 Tax=Acinetobacter proteolyticus TaxID=1776741 RepID=A0A2N0W9T4_9GAMM|nr:MULTISPECIES: helix-turn-helix transcriptional regulator [Acinetobacter]PKF31248.1 hypothetical protein CW311_19475 [Acinetobacter proteolyticus]USA47437.1 helix-turn-helix transcriptional regulator [Acinetobacter sp. C26M]USA50918.1 helix-turn-helix transcriptional regulator [Acinetobacter sp. C26G]
MNYQKWTLFVDNFISSLMDTIIIDAYFAYRINSNLKTFDHYFKNINKNTIEYYLKKMQQHDPLFIGKSIPSEDDILVLSKQPIPLQYENFMQKNNIGDNIELYFKFNKIPVLGISLIRNKKNGCFTNEEFIFLKCYQNFTNKYLQEELINNKVKFPFQKYKITKKEEEIIRLICMGKNNEQISKILFISISTVKTHIQHIFQKIQVNNKHQLVSRLHGNS